MANTSDPAMSSSAMTARMRDQHRAISALTRSRILRSGELNLSMMEITEVAAKTLKVGRSSIWLYNKEKTKIVCQDLYRIEEGHGLHEQSIELYASDYPAYFEAISEARTIAAHDAHSHEATKEFSIGYLAPLGIQSMLDAPIFVSGQMVGVVCQEHIGQPRHWELDEEHFVGSIADMVAMALESSNRKLAQEQLEIRIGQIAALVEVSRSIISVLDIDSLLVQVIDTIGLVMNAEASSLLLIEDGPEGKQLRFRFSRGSASADLYHDTIQMGEGFAGWVALNGVPLIIDDAYTDCRFNPRFDKKTGFRTRSVITVHCVAIIIKFWELFRPSIRRALAALIVMTWSCFRRLRAWFPSRWKMHSSLLILGSLWNRRDAWLLRRRSWGHSCQEWLLMKFLKVVKRGSHLGGRLLRQRSFFLILRGSHHCLN